MASGAFQHPGESFLFQKLYEEIKYFRCLAPCLVPHIQNGKTEFSIGDKVPIFLVYTVHKKGKMKNQQHGHYRQLMHYMTTHIKF